jgi:drug/metabolite transporter (DMT)-like permease
MIRSTFSLMLTMFVVRAEKWTSYLGTRQLWPTLATRGFVGAASMTLYYEAIDRMPLADAVRFANAQNASAENAYLVVLVT